MTDTGLSLGIFRWAGAAIAIWLTAASVAPAQEATFDAGLRAYHKGHFGRALEIWAPIADAGLPEAQYNMGLIHHRGKGVTTDAGEAYTFYLRAAEGGYARAQYRVAEMLEAGDGIRPDLPRAHFWFAMAKRQKYEDASKRRRRLAKRMTSSEIAMAELRMRQQKRRENGRPDEVSLD